jgi:hypothetical protein
MTNAALRLWIMAMCGCILTGRNYSRIESEMEKEINGAIVAPC